VETFICRNKNCKSLEYTRFGKQFTLNTSNNLLKLIHSILNDVLTDMMQKNASKVFIAEKYGISPATLSYISKKMEESMQKSEEMVNLVKELQEDIAIAIDETFLKINNTTVYIILATGYSSRKVIGALVCEHRSETEMRQVFDEADRNTTRPIEVVTCDAWGATRSMVKNLNRPMTLIIHKHKTPYDRAVIQRFEYKDDIREITELGIKTDFFKKRGKREYFQRTLTESTLQKPKGKRGRPKGMKNGQGKKKQKKGPKKKRGRKGLFTVFLGGARKYAKIDPYRNSVKLGKQTNAAAQTAMRDAMNLFCGMCVQNNIAESINSLLRLHFRFSGPKTMIGIENRLRCYIYFHNSPEWLSHIQLNYDPHGIFFNSMTNIGKIAPLL
jgi:transcriptional regulator